MRQIGLIPTATGEIGGKETGQKVSHVIDRQGPFAMAAASLLRDHPAILYHDRWNENEETRRKKAASKANTPAPLAA